MVLLIAYMLGLDAEHIEKNADIDTVTDLALSVDRRAKPHGAKLPFLSDGLTNPSLYRVL